MSRAQLIVVLDREMRPRGLNPHSLAKAAGLHKDAIRDLYRGKIDSLGPHKLRAIARYLGIPVSAFLEENADKMPEQGRREESAREPGGSFGAAGVVAAVGRC